VSREGERKLDIEELQTFVEVADAGGVTPAARRMGLAKSIVSRRLARLEAELDVQLLARTTRGAALTEAGANFRDHAARVVAEIEAARDAISSEGGLRGRLRIAAPLSFGPPLATVLAKMARRYPLLHIHSCYTDRKVDIVSEGYDCAIRLGYLQDSNLIARRIGPIYGKLVASPDYIKAHGAPEKPSEILNHEALMQGTESWRFMDGEKTITVVPQGRFKADNASALVAAAVEGIGLAYVPEGVMQQHLDSGALVPVMTKYTLPAAAAYVVRPPGGNPSPKVRVLIEMLIGCFEQHAPT
jgi:DNA-binding transcriptional LysR family regulator